MPVSYRSTILGPYLRSIRISLHKNKNGRIRKLSLGLRALRDELGLKMQDFSDCKDQLGHVRYIWFGSLLYLLR